MALIAAVTATVRAVKVIDLESGPASAAIVAGQLVDYVAATGQWVVADSAVARAKGIAITGANQAGITIDVLKKGIVDVGSVLDTMPYGAPVWTAATVGRMDDAVVAGLDPIGMVVPGRGTTTPDYLLRIDC